MLTKFSVKNFKNFKDEIVFDLSKSRDYQFNKECIKDGIVNKSIIYGKNASGKTNLVLAIFDIISNLTDKIAIPHGNVDNPYIFYKNLQNLPSESVEFNYEFMLGSKKIEYSYKKMDKDIFTYEKLVIDDVVVVEHDRYHDNSQIKLNWDSLENSGFDISLKDDKLSAIKYIYKNSKVKDFSDGISKAFIDFMQFVEQMLMFYSLEKRGFIGYETTSSKNVFKEIIARNRLQDFQQFLASFGLNYDLVETIDDFNTPTIAIKFGETKVLFHKICSSGTSALALFYFWYMDIEKIKLLVIDEFDAFYHHKLSSDIVRKLIENNCQVILTTHNTSVMTNDLMRPDCYFRINQNGITSLADATPNEIRKVHNLEKIYRSGWFDE
jgi:AAA15 family ATPase/GTPase